MQEAGAGGRPPEQAAANFPIVISHLAFFIGIPDRAHNEKCQMIYGKSSVCPLPPAPAACRLRLPPASYLLFSA